MAKPTRRPRNPTLETRVRDVWHKAPQSVRRRVWGVIERDQRNAIEALEMYPGATAGDIARRLGVDFGDARHMLERALELLEAEMRAWG